MKTATLATYNPSLIGRLYGHGRDLGPHDEVNLTENEDLAKKWEEYYKITGWKILGKISFEDARALEEIAADFAKKVGTGNVERGEKCVHIDVSHSQRPIIQQAFVEYFLRR